MELTELSYDQMEQEAQQLGLALPIEQTAVWARLEKTIEGKTPWGALRVERNGKPVAFVGLIDYQTHGYHYLRASHGPVWVGEPSSVDELDLINSLRAYVRKRDHRQVFVRMAVKADLPECSPTLSTIPYNQTVIMDISGTQDDILARMKPRGRRDVRKALRESPATYADETEQATQSFEEYYAVMLETAERDGFSAGTLQSYENMIRILGPEHCRVFAGRVDGRVVTWTIATVNGSAAVRYYGASSSDVPNRNYVTDGLIYFEACTLSADGVTTYDMMGIGNDFAPSLKGLNTFKTKFAKDVVSIAPDRDVPLRPIVYGSLVKARQLLKRGHAAEDAQGAGQTDKTVKVDKPTNAAAVRDDILPVILGGDVSSYPMAREFNEAYGVRSICIVPLPIRIITTSRFIDVHEVPNMEADTLREAIGAIAAEHASKRVILIANSDAVVERLESFASELPANVLCSLPPHDPMMRASNKITFAQMCAEFGLDAPRTEAVQVAGTDPIPPTSIPFPLIAKPAMSSAEYFLLYAKGFKKVYFINDQAELDQLWDDLRAEHYSGDFILQELIEGDDTYVDMITAYVNQAGKTTMLVSGQVLLEDHSPALMGNPVAIMARPMPELWDKVARMLESIGWRGFANFDIKRDPHTGRALFLDFNPRLGANSYYACVGGVNPMRALVDDFVDGKDDVQRTAHEGLYARTEPRLIRHYLVDEALRDEFDALVRAKKVANPLRYNKDTVVSQGIGRAMELNFNRKFAKYYPEPTAHAF